MSEWTFHWFNLLRNEPEMRQVKHPVEEETVNKCGSTDRVIFTIS